jgi:histidyl-tRNA synthetase
MTQFKTVRGMRDFLSEDAHTMRHIEETARHVSRLYGYKEIITPVVEPYELLAAKAGEEVRSRMFTFNDLGDRRVALRPEFTASLARVVATKLRNEPRPFRLFAVGSIYRYDEPQRGRYREFWQSDYELMGSDRPEADAEILMLTNNLMKQAGLERYAFKIGHVGIMRGIFNQEKLNEKAQDEIMQLMDKKQYDDAFMTVEKAGASEKCQQVLRKLVATGGKDAKKVIDEIRKYAEDYGSAVEAAGNLEDIAKIICESGAGIDLTIEAGFERGLEYYTGMIFEVYIPHLDIAFGGGGRYDRLIELYGGDPTPAVGVAHGLDRIMLGLQEQKVKSTLETASSVMVIPIGDGMRCQALKISGIFRAQGISVETEVLGRRITKALEDADRRKMRYAILVGEKETKQETVVIRDLSKRDQKTVRIDEAIDIIKKTERSNLDQPLQREIV